MDKKNQQLAEQLCNLSWDDTPDAAHRNRLEADLLRAWTTRRESQQTVSRWRVLTRKGQAIMTSRTTRYSTVAAVIIAVVLGWTFLPRSSNPGGTAWALEQSIAALDGVRTILITGAVDGPTHPFRYWARHDPRTDQFRFRYESDDEVCVFDGTKGYAYQPGDRSVITFQPNLDLGVVKFSAESLVMQLWVRGEMLSMLKRTAQGWQETAGQDEQTLRPCVYVTCSYDLLDVSLWVEFDQQTKLPVRARLWTNLQRQGTPIFDASRIVYDEPVLEDQFHVQIPEGATLVDSGAGLSLLAVGQVLFNGKYYDQAIAMYEQIVEKYPAWSGAEEALMMIGICHDNKGEHDKAIVALERAVRDYANQRDLAATYFYLGAAYQGAERLDDAIAAYQQSVERAERIGRGDVFPGKLSRERIGWIRHSEISTTAERLYSENKLEEAIPAYQAVVDAVPHTQMAQEAQMMLGICHRKLGHFDLAVEFLEHAVRDYADIQTGATSACCFYLGDVYQKVGRKEDAIKACIQCVQLADRAGRHEGFPADSARSSIAALQLELFGQNIPDWANVIDVAAERERIAASQAAQSSPAQ